MALPSPFSLRGTAAVPTPPRTGRVHLLLLGGEGVPSCVGLTEPKKPSSLSWASSFPGSTIFSSSLRLIKSPSPLPWEPQVGIVRAAWTRRSQSEASKKPNRKSWKQWTDMYMRPFLLNEFFSNKFIHAKVMHRGTSKGEHKCKESKEYSTISNGQRCL